MTWGKLVSHLLAAILKNFLYYAFECEMLTFQATYLLDIALNAHIVLEIFKHNNFPHSTSSAIIDPLILKFRTPFDVSL